MVGILCSDFGRAAARGRRICIKNGSFTVKCVPVLWSSLIDTLVGPMLFLSDKVRGPTLNALTVELMCITSILLI